MKDQETGMLKCANCGKELLGDVYRVDQGSFGDRSIGHFLEDFKFWRHIGYFCSDCIERGVTNDNRPKS